MAGPTSQGGLEEAEKLVARLRELEAKGTPSPAEHRLS